MFGSLITGAAAAGKVIKDLVDKGTGGKVTSAINSAAGGGSNKGGGDGGGSGQTSYPNGYTQKYTGGNASLDSALKGYSDRYNTARAQGDWQGMREASDGANQIRNQFGFAAEDASKDISYIAAQYGGAGGGSSGYSPAGGGQQVQQGPEYTDYWDDIQARYDQQAAAEQAAIDAYIKQTVNSLGSQKSGVNQSAEELARQAYVSYMQSADKLPQALAASGYSGGMADSQALALETGLQNNQNQIMLNRDNTLNDIESAIINAQLEGSIQGAQSQADIGRDAISAFQNYMQQQNAYANQDFWTRYGYDYNAGQAQVDRDWQSQQSQINRDWQTSEGDKDRQDSQSTTEQKVLQQQVLEMIQAGMVPPDDMLTAANISKAYAQSMAPWYAQNLAAENEKTYGSGRSSGDSSSMSLSTAKDMANSGEFDEAVLAALHKAGYSDAYLASTYGYDPTGGNGGNGGTGPTVDTASVAALGYGPLDAAALAELEAQGAIESYTEGNKIKFRRKTIPSSVWTSTKNPSGMG